MLKRVGLLAVVVSVFIALLAPAALAATRNNVLLPNGCRIDAGNDWKNMSGVVNGRTHEDYGCEKMQTRIRFYDDNDERWETHQTPYWAGNSSRNVDIDKWSTQPPKWTDHNGRAGGTDWGFRLYY